MKLHIKKMTAERFFEMFLILFWTKDIIFSYVRAIILRIPYIKYTADYILPVLMIVCLAFASPYLVKSFAKRDIIFLFSVGIVYWLHMMLFKENESLGQIAGTFWTMVFPLYFIGLRLESQKHWRLLYTLSIINIWVFAVYSLVISDNVLIGPQSEYVSYMGRAYILLPQLLVALAGMLKQRNIINIISSFLGFFLLLMMGNRGSVLLTMFFVLAYVVFVLEKKKRFRIEVIIVASCAVLYLYFEKIILGLIYLSTKIGFSSRTLLRLLEGSFFQSSGRNKIIDQLKVAIWEKPLVGHGLTADRTIAGLYAHNFAFELWTAFGIFVGSILLCTTVYLIAKAWLKSTEKKEKSILLLLICIGFLKLFISSSFLLEGAFFLLLGVCVSQIRRAKSISEISKEDSINENL